ncbi:splicing factor 3A subunit 3-like [Styela clava]
METTLEQQRRLHEEKERLYDAMTKESMHKKSAVREQINSDHRMRHLLDRVMDNSVRLQELYEDKDGLRKAEIQAIAGPNEFGEFYKRLREIKDFHKKHPNEVFVPMSMEFEELNQARENASDEATILVEFTDEESYGRFLDLHESHLRYINIKGIEKLTYVRYLDAFDRLFEIPRDRKNTQYHDYIDGLLQYLVSFVERIKPLLDLNVEHDEVLKKFELQWETNEFPGWGKEAGSAMAHSGAHLDLSAFTSAEELASLGLDRLKSALMALSLKCGGTLEQRAERLFSTKGKTMDEIETSLYSKSKIKAGKKDLTSQRNKETAMVEAQIYHLVELVSEQRAATRDNVQRRQARTDTERDEDEDDVMSDSDSGDDEDEVIYNPKNLPLGWDGKPIPYWLYKLHGLNINYSCEICGNQTYRGPKAFQRHFAEWRHAHGMRCLGIPNTAHFANVTKIEDAMALWSKIKEMKNAERWNPDQEEEYEDSAGNVVSKKTYEDLKRQGLL